MSNYWWRVTTEKWICCVERFEVTKETEKTLTFIDHTWGDRPTRSNLESSGYSWFKKLSEARSYAAMFIDKRIEFHNKKIKDFEKDMTDVFNIKENEE